MYEILSEVPRNQNPGAATVMYIVHVYIYITQYTVAKMVVWVKLLKNRLQF